MFYGKIITAVPVAKNNFATTSNQTSQFATFNHLHFVKPGKANSKYMAMKYVRDNYSKDLAPLVFGSGNELEVTMETESFDSGKTIDQLVKIEESKFSMVERYRREFVRSTKEFYYTCVDENNVVISNYNMDEGMQSRGTCIVSIRRDTDYNTPEQKITQKVRFYNHEFRIQAGVDSSFKIKRSYEFPYHFDDFDNYVVSRDKDIYAWYIQRGSNSIIRVCVRGDHSIENVVTKHTIDFECEDPNCLVDEFTYDVISYLELLDKNFGTNGGFIDVCDIGDFKIVAAPTFEEDECLPELINFSLFMLDNFRLKMVKPEKIFVPKFQFNRIGGSSINDPNDVYINPDVPIKMDTNEDDTYEECYDQWEECLNELKHEMDNGEYPNSKKLKIKN